MREKQRQREALSLAARKNPTQKIHKSRKEHMQSCKKTEIPNVRRFEIPHDYNTYFIDQDSSSSAYGTDASRTASLQKTSSTEILEEDLRRGRSHDSGVIGERPKSREIQRRNSGRRQRPVVKTANKFTVDRSRAKSEGKREPALQDCFKKIFLYSLLIFGS